jgi:hypothetical protein
MMHTDLNLFYLTTLKSLALTDPAAAAFMGHADQPTITALRHASTERLRDVAQLPFVLAVPLPNLAVVLARPMPADAQASVLLSIVPESG